MVLAFFKKISLVVLLLLVPCIVSNAAKKKEKEAVKCTATQFDGKKITGYIVDGKTKKISYGSDHMYNIYSVSIADTPEGKGNVYTADDVKEITCTFEDGTKVVFKSLYMLKNATWPRNLKHGSMRTFYPVAYQKKGILGFACQTKDVDFAAWSNGYLRYDTNTRYCYCLEGDETVIPYYKDYGKNSLATGQKNWIAKCFERFPKMFEYIKSDDFVYKTFKKDPFSVLDKLGTLK